MNRMMLLNTMARRAALALALVAAPATFADDGAAPAANPAPAVSAPAADANAKAPSIFSPEPTFNFGKQDSEHEVKHDFTIVNVGTDTLEIKNVRTSCGCTVAELAKKVLAPGEETVVSATLKLKGKQGKQAKDISVESNDPSQPVYKLRLEGEAVPAILYEPQFFKFGRIEDDEIHSAKVSIRANKEGLAFKITNVDVADKTLKADVVTVEEGRAYDITLSNTGPMKEGNLNALVTISTDNPERPTLQIRANAQVIGTLEVLPDQLNVTYSGDEAKKTTQYMRVGAGRVKEFKITEVSTDAPGVVTELIERGSNNYNIKVAEIPSNESIEGKSITIKTSLAEKPEIKIPFNLVKLGAKGLGANLGALRGAVPGAAAPAAPAPAPAPAAPAPAPAPAQ